jgi:hypothetical protein
MPDPRCACSLPAGQKTAILCLYRHGIFKRILSPPGRQVHTMSYRPSLKEGQSTLSFKSSFLKRNPSAFKHLRRDRMRDDHIIVQFPGLTTSCRGRQPVPQGEIL